MASRNLFTEEGRTRFRNFGVRLRSYLIVFLGLGLVAGAFWFSRGEMAALERLYFRQYTKATVMSWISPARPGRYTLLTSGAIGVTDQLVYQVKDEQGRPARNQYGLVFKPHNGVRIEEPRWRSVRSAHGAMEAWLRQKTYRRGKFAGIVRAGARGLPVDGGGRDCDRAGHRSTRQSQLRAGRQASGEQIGRARRVRQGS